MLPLPGAWDERAFAIEVDTIIRASGTVPVRKNNLLGKGCLSNVSVKSSTPARHSPTASPANLLPAVKLHGSQGVPHHTKQFINIHRSTGEGWAAGGAVAVSGMLWRRW